MKAVVTDNEKAAFIGTRGWHQYYNDNYWVNRKRVEVPSRQDYTNYGMTLDEAFEAEMSGKDVSVPYLNLDGAINYLKSKNR